MSGLSRVVCWAQCLFTVPVGVLNLGFIAVSIITEAAGGDGLQYSAYIHSDTSHVGTDHSNDMGI